MQILQRARDQPRQFLLAVPLCTIFFMLWLDVFDLRGLLLPDAVHVPASTRSSTAAASALSDAAAVDRPPTQVPEPSPEPPYQPPERKFVEQPTLRFSRCREHPAEPPASAAEVRRGVPPKVGLSMALHPPKFHSAGLFLKQYAACPGAVKALAIFMIFTDAADAALLREALACLHPEIPEDIFMPVVAMQPKGGWRHPSQSANQFIAAYKKWAGVAYMMDMEVGAPEYGVMVDSELLMFDNGGDGERGPSCSAIGPWRQLHARIQAQDLSMRWPGARVSETLTVYDFGNYKMSGKSYDKSLISENANFASKGTMSRCESEGCDRVREQIDLCIFSWWTDVPWVKLDHARRMFVELSGQQAAPPNAWQTLSSQLRFTRFEHLSYQQWTVIHEGFSFWDVTNITGYAKWGSYMEDPVPGAKLAQLKPIWISGEALERVEGGTLPPLNQAFPPLLIFHADKGRERDGRAKNRDDWESVVLELLKKQKRTDWNEGNFRN